MEQIGIYREESYFRFFKYIRAVSYTHLFRNKSCSQNVFGLKISLSTENKGIEFEKNSFYVQALAPGEAITLEQMITITENCDPGQAVITFSLDYEDSKATATTGTEAPVSYTHLSVRNPDNQGTGIFYEGKCTRNQ